ncbi:MAG: potassium transporter Kup [Alphaproteobacteria bacterium]|nr:potassium transporter Kup [Alphaproteobacteria bacterium]
MNTPSETPDQKNAFKLLVLGCIGVVYGDIGTSPLYAFKDAAGHLTKGGFDPAEILGILSLIIWTLIIIVTCKYVLFLLHADNKGEGGTLALMAMVKKNIMKIKPQYTGVVFMIGLLGASLFFGDAVITPAISVLSAVEGLKLVTPAFESWVLPITIGILTCLFAIQKNGTHRVSQFFGPITALWFMVMAAMGIRWIIETPEILMAFNPYYAVYFMATHGMIGLMVLGAVFLAITGAEALYADLGHFGRKPIQYAWLYLIFPCLVLNYLGQGALVLKTEGAIQNPFFLMVPEYLLLPLVFLATVATIIASQAVITGAFSVALQAMRLGLIPRLEVKHTSADHHGQIYMPRINMLLFIAVILACLLFKTSSNLAAAYGIAVTGEMLMTTCLAFFLIRYVWKKTLLFTLSFLIPLVMLELVFFSANLLKLFDGGMVPLLFASYLVLLMTIWVKGSRFVIQKASRQTVPLSDFAEQIDRAPPIHVPGTAIYLTADPIHTPFTLVQNLRHNRVIHEHNIIVSVATSFKPKVEDEFRLTVDRISSQLTRVTIHFGFMDRPDVPTALRLGTRHGLDIDLQNVSYFLGHRTFISDPHVGLPGWQDKIYIALAKIAAPATDFYSIPPDQVVEIGVQTYI